MLLNEALFEELDDEVEIEYSDLEIERNHGSSSGYFSTSFGNWLPDEDWKTYYVDWTYTVDTWDVIDVLTDIIRKKDPKMWEEIPEDENEFVKYFEKNFDEIYKKYEQDIYNYYYDDAKEEAEAKADVNDYDFDPY